jgi:hypothetical protein
MTPEDRLREAIKQCNVLLNHYDAPDDLFREVLDARKQLESAKEDIADWRDFVDDAEVVEE